MVIKLCLFVNCFIRDSLTEFSDYPKDLCDCPEGPHHQQFHAFSHNESGTNDMEPFSDEEAKNSKIVTKSKDRKSL